MSGGLYVHVPFCLTRCGYCDFNSYSGLGYLRSRYARALSAEADLAAPAWVRESFVSVFLGGGTPTMLDTEDLVAVLAHMRSRFDITDDAEATIEANPDTVNEAKLSALRIAGYTRLSVGVQSFDARVLALLGRVHSPASARCAYAAARAAGFANVNVDLIYGAEGETLESWRETLAETVALGSEHISAYALTVEQDTPFGRAVAAGAKPAPDSDLQADMFALACEALATAGYGHYEVSNWAKPGFECRHNLGYWRRRPYLGLGAGAHSFRGGHRWWNICSPEVYLRAVEGGCLPTEGEEVLGAAEVRTEELLLGLRAREGVVAVEVDAEVAARFVTEGLLARRNGSYVLTERGMFLANDVVVALSGRPPGVDRQGDRPQERLDRDFVQEPLLSIRGRADPHSG